jgi:misacylated tRNA(Ala) deacylase
VQLGAERSRIDFKLAGFTREQIPELEERVNEVLTRALPVRSSTIPEAEFLRRPDLVRTLEVKPPVIAGRVRVVEIVGFDAQACGGTHVHTMSAIRWRAVDHFPPGGDERMPALRGAHLRLGSRRECAEKDDKKAEQARRLPEKALE